MDSQYVNCPKCRVRNFSDDKVCGICKANLTATNQSSNQTYTTYKISRSGWLLIISLILVIYATFFRKDQQDRSSSKENYNKIYLENSPEFQLGIINDQTKTPNQVTINLFSNLLSSLSIKYHRSERDIANSVVACYNPIKYNNKESLLEFMNAFDSYSAEIDGKYNMTLEESIAIFTKITYKI